MSFVSDKQHTVESRQDPAFWGVLIKKEAFLGPVYFLDIRSKADPYMAGKVNFFSGRHDIKEHNTAQTAARQKLGKYLGIEVSDDDLKERFEFSGVDTSGNKTTGTVFIVKYRMLDNAMTTKNIKRHLGREKTSIEFMKDDRSPIVKIVKIKRLFWNFYVRYWCLPINWTGYTAAAIHALIDDYESDRRARFWTPQKSGKS
jgi:hypothetical protein